MCLTPVWHGLVISLRKRVSMKQADNDNRVLAKRLAHLTAVPSRVIIVTSQTFPRTVYDQEGLITQTPES
jgi:hypothetical protein